MTIEQEWGTRTETKALAYFLAQPGFRLVVQNFRVKGGELDLVFEEQLTPEKKELVFVEVRARARGGWVSAEESVTFPKRRRLGRAIQKFLVGYRGEAKTLRIDLMAWDGERWTHLKDLRF